MKVHGGLPLLLLLGAAAACNKSDVGKPCGTEPDSLPAEPIVGEQPVPEVVRLERDGACESFQCLRHRGLPPYCTRACEMTEGKGGACAAHSECEEPSYCKDGTCVDDDCPEGFWCRAVQEAGSLADQTFCVRRDGCSKNLECEKIGDIVCQRWGCFDACLMAGRACSGDAPCPTGTECDTSTGRCTCSYSQLVCLPEAELPCACPGGGMACTDRELCCTADPTSPECWPVDEPGSVTRTGLCFHKEPFE